MTKKKSKNTKNSEETGPEVIKARHTNEPINIDGFLNDNAWENAERYSLMLGGDQGGGRPQEKGDAMLLWDDNFLYVGIFFEDSEIVQEGEKDQMHLYNTGDLVEIFLKPADSPWYWEIYCTPNNRRTAFFFKGQKGEGKPLYDDFENISHLKNMDVQVAANVNGELNNRKTKDKYWTAELAIPARGLTQYGNDFGYGADWRVLIARYNYDNHLEEKELSMLPKLSRTKYHLVNEYAMLKLE